MAWQNIPPPSALRRPRGDKEQSVPANATRAKPRVSDCLDHGSATRSSARFGIRPATAILGRRGRTVLVSRRRAKVRSPVGLEGSRPCGPEASRPCGPGRPTAAALDGSELTPDAATENVGSMYASQCLLLSLPPAPALRTAGGLSRRSAPDRARRHAVDEHLVPPDAEPLRPRFVETVTGRRLRAGCNSGSPRLLVRCGSLAFFGELATHARRAGVGAAAYLNAGALTVPDRELHASCARLLAMPRDGESAAAPTRSRCLRRRIRRGRTSPRATPPETALRRLRLAAARPG
jgi:hypothetical protein